MPTSKTLYKKLKTVYPQLTGVWKKRADRMIRYRDEDSQGAIPRTREQKLFVQMIIDSNILNKTKPGNHTES